MTWLNKYEKHQKKCLKTLKKLDLMAYFSEENLTYWDKLILAINMPSKEIYCKFRFIITNVMQYNFTIDANENCSEGYDSQINF